YRLRRTRRTHCSHRRESPAGRLAGTNLAICCDHPPGEREKAMQTEQGERTGTRVDAGRPAGARYGEEVLVESLLATFPARGPIAWSCAGAAVWLGSSCSWTRDPALVDRARGVARGPIQCPSSDDGRWGSDRSGRSGRSRWSLREA